MSIKLHIDNWISKSDPDYYTMFIKAWIPFNAWYFNEYSTTKDHEALDKLKNTPNKVKNRIIALLTNKDVLSNHFRSHLCYLHNELQNRSIINKGKKVSFESVVIDGVVPSPVTDTDKNGNIYKAIPHLTNGYRAIIITKANKTLMDKTFNPYDINLFLTENQYIALADRKVKEKIKNCFLKIDPKRATNLLSNSKNKSDYIELDASLKIKFINDPDLIAKGLLQILYDLRCLLFHGVLDPTQINQAMYEHAFFILKPILNELK
jgi:hypothetical protein